MGMAQVTDLAELSDGPLAQGTSTLNGAEVPTISVRFPKGSARSINVDRRDDDDAVPVHSTPRSRIRSLSLRSFNRRPGVDATEPYWIRPHDRRSNLHTVRGTRQCLRMSHRQFCFAAVLYNSSETVER